jgi:hypothetical protein
MTLESLSYIAQIAGAIAVVASLVFVGFQLRHSTEQTKQANALARADMSERTMRSFGENVRDLMNSHELSEIFRKVMFEKAELTPVETTRILLYFNLTLHAHRTAFLYVKQGLLDPDVMIAFDHNTTWCLTAPIFAREWKRNQRVGTFGRTEFDAYLTAKFAELRPAETQSAPAEEAP